MLTFDAALPPYWDGSAQAIGMQSAIVIECWSGYALQREGLMVSPVVLPGVNAEGKPNLGYGRGCIRFWFAPSWESGKGPGQPVRLAEWMVTDGNQVGTLWALTVNEDGTVISLDDQGGELLEAEIAWETGGWHCLALDYNEAGSALLVDGKAVAVGRALLAVDPKISALVIGSDWQGLMVAGGLFDEVRCFAEPMSEKDIAFYYQGLAGVAALRPISDEEMAALYALAKESNEYDGGTYLRMGFDESNPCPTNGPLFMTNLWCELDTNGGGWSFVFDVAGGSNGVLYDVFGSVDLTSGTTTNGAWYWLTNTYQCETVVLTNQPEFMTLYRLAGREDSDGDGLTDAVENLVSATSWTTNDTDGDGVQDGWEWDHGLNPHDSADAGDDPDGDWLTNYQEYLAGSNPHDVMVLAWGLDHGGQLAIPENLRNVVAVDGGFDFSAALRGDGTVLAWGANAHGQTNAPGAPANLTAISTGPYHGIASRSDGTVSVWGAWWPSDSVYHPASVPSGLGNAVAVAAGADHDLVLHADGSVSAWGYYGNAPYTELPTNLPPVQGLAAGWEHSALLLNDGTVRAFGPDLTGYGMPVTNVPAGLNQVIAIAAGAYHTLALRADGTVVAWGAGESGGGMFDYGQATVPAGLSNVVAISAGGFHSLALTADGEVVVWGDLDTFPHPGANITAMASGEDHALAIRSGRLIPLITLQPVSQTAPADANVNFTAGGLGLAGVRYQWQYDGVNLSGETNATLPLSGVQWYDAGDYTCVISTGAGSVTTDAASLTVLDTAQILPGGVAAWGANDYHQSDIVTTETNVLAIAAGAFHSALVREDGSLFAWGLYTNLPANVTNAIAVTAGAHHSLALQADGTVVSWGATNWPANTVPGNLPPVRALASGWYHNVALLTNGTVTNWGNGLWNQLSLPDGLGNVTAIAAGAYHTLALKADGTVVSWGYNGSGQTNVPANLTHVVAVAGGGRHSLALKEDGTLTAWGEDTLGQCTIPAGATNVMVIAAGYQYSLALKNDGTLLAWGDNTYGQCNVPTNLHHVKLLAASAYHSLAAMFSPLVQYPVEVSQDLLLIYNTNSADSAFVKDYYLAHRPMVSEANVLGLGYTNPVSPGYYETISPQELTNQLFTPLLSWLEANPTKRPQYVILFMELPARVSSSSAAPSFNVTNGIWYYPSATPYGSVSVQLQSLAAGWQPFTTHINMGMTNTVNRTNGCVAYINKLAALGTNRAPGSPLLSASAAGYGNVTYAVDDVRYPGNSGSYIQSPAVSSTTNGLLAAGVSTSNIIYITGIESNSVLPHITSATNVAGYISWGFHSSLNRWYAIDGTVKWHGDSGWYLIETIESSNGLQYSDSGNFDYWYADNAFGGTNYSNTPVGVVTHVAEPQLPFVNDSKLYFEYWANMKCFGVCAWESRKTHLFQAVGDPLIVK